MTGADGTPQHHEAVAGTQKLTLIDHAIRLALVGLLAVWSMILLSPFVVILAWAIVLTVALYPAHSWLSARLGGREGVSAGLLTLVGLMVIVGPVAVLAVNTASSAEALFVGLRDGTLTPPLPPESIRAIPLVGERIHETWSAAATNIVGFLGAHSETFLSLGGKLLGSFAGAGTTVLFFIASIVVSGLLYRPAPRMAAFARRLGGRVAGQRGVDFIAMAGATIRNVSRGVMGISIAQSLLLGIGMLVAGVPAAGLLTVVTLILCIVQVGPGLVVVGVLIWAWSSLGTGAALLLTAYMIPVTLGDNAIKPVIMSKGLSTPTLLIFAGVLGGTIAHGLIGLFLGPIVLAVSYDLLMAWLAEDEGGADRPDPA